MLWSNIIYEIPVWDSCENRESEERGVSLTQNPKLAEFRGDPSGIPRIPARRYQNVSFYGNAVSREQRVGVTAEMGNRIPVAILLWKKLRLKRNVSIELYKSLLTGDVFCV